MVLGAPLWPLMRTCVPVVCPSSICQRAAYLEVRSDVRGPVLESGLKAWEIDSSVELTTDGLEIGY